MATSPTAPLPPTSRGTSERKRRASRWILPAVTFLVGLALGALLIWFARPARTDDGAAAATPVTSPTAMSQATPGADGDGPSAGPAGSAATITVPVSCVRLADDVQQAKALLDEAATAARQVDTSRLADLVRQMGTVRNTLESEAASCRAAAGSLSVRSPAGASPTG